MTLTTNEEVALLFVARRDWTNFKITFDTLSAEEQALVENQMTIEESLDYESWEANQKEAPPADFSDEITHPHENIH